MNRYIERIGSVLLAVWMLVSIFALTGCSGKPKGDRSDRRKPKLEKAETAAEQILESLMAGDEQIPVLAPDGTPASGGENEGLAQVITSMLEYEILSVTEEDDTATAAVRITAPDTPAILDDVLADMDVYDAEIFVERMEDALRTDSRTVEFTVEVTLQGVDGIWYLVPDGQLTNAMTGGLLQVYADQVQAIQDGLTGGNGT